MEKSNADNIMKTVFKKNVGQSYIQLQYNKNKNKDEQDDREQEKEIQKNVDVNSGVLSRRQIGGKGITTLKKQGFLYNVEASGSLFSCFCGTRRAVSVILENRVLRVLGPNSSIIETINFDTLSVVLKVQVNSIKIKLNSDQKKEIYLQTTQNENLNEWEIAIKKSIEGSVGTQHELNYLTSIPRFWEVTHSQLSLKASQHLTSVRIVTQVTSYFLGVHMVWQRFSVESPVHNMVISPNYLDHIALVLRNVKDEVLLFESNSDTGVAVTFWKDMVRFKWYEGADKYDQKLYRVVYRELRNVERDEQFLKTLEGFVADNMDKKFGIGIGKLMKFTSKLGKQKDNENEKTDRTFFCSQLVAKAYKELGLLEPSKSSTQYWPGCFSQKKILPLLRGNFGPQKIICFDRSLCKKK